MAGFDNDEQEKQFKRADKIKLKIPFYKLYFIILYFILIGIIIYAI